MSEATCAHVQVESICRISGCLSTVLAKDLCSKHYQRWRRYGRVERVYEVSQGKQCKLCQEPVSAKGLCAKHHRKQLHMKVIEATLEPSPR